jgi:protein-S-isoprenylcysteine O-methyltransferase Ste14
MTTILWLLVSLFAQAIVILYPGVFVFWLIMHNNIERLRPMGIRAYWVAVFAWSVTAMPLLLLRQRLFSVRWLLEPPWEGVMVAVGVAAFTAGAFIFGQARREIPWRTIVGLPEVEPQKNKQRVLNAGIYSRTRNPIYLGHWLFVFSAAALSGYAANWIGVVVDCLVLPVLIRAEERELLARYGREFAEYMDRVPRLIPRLTTR